jgi:hypothetical protein
MNLDLDQLHYKLRALRTEGYFVSITPKEDYFIIECRIYIVDRDDETGTMDILEVPGDSYGHGTIYRDENNKCLGCKSVPGEVRTIRPGSISCPLSCGSFTKPFALTEKVYRAKLGSNLTGLPPMMLSTISAVLKS